MKGHSYREDNSLAYAFLEPAARFKSQFQLENRHAVEH